MDVFISYSSKEKSTANALCHYLEANAVKCWIAPRDIKSGEIYGDVIPTAIKSCKILIVVFSESANMSKWVKSEVRIAFDNNLIIIPFKIDKAEPTGQMELYLSGQHWLEAYPEPAKYFHKLSEDVKSLLGNNSIDISKNSTNINKYSSTKKEKKKSRFLYLFLLCVALFLFRKESSYQTVNGNGNVVRQERPANGFYGISTSGAATLNIQPGEDYKVVVTTDDNLQDFVLAEVKSNVLNISSKQNFSPTKFVIDIHLPELKNINITGSSNVKISNGNASDLKISLSGSGRIDTQNYQVQNVAVTISGAATAIVWATNSLTGTLSGAGIISYKGDPTVSVNVSGVGKVTKL